jgi:exosortase/archaeosortase
MDNRLQVAPMSNRLRTPSAVGQLDSAKVSSQKSSIFHLHFGQLDKVRGSLVVTTTSHSTIVTQHLQVYFSQLDSAMLNSANLQSPSRRVVLPLTPFSSETLFLTRVNWTEKFFDFLPKLPPSASSGYVN